MNDIKAILKLMILATENIILPENTVVNAKHFNCRIGSGKKTYVRKKIKNGCYHYTLTYGFKMLISKQTKMKALLWTSGKEITNRNYFVNPSFKDMIIACILHEFAHVVQFKVDGVEPNSIHNKHFYEILDGFYDKNLHIKLDKYLSQFIEYENAKYTNEDTPLNRDDLKGAKYLKIKTKTSHMFMTVEKLNPKKVKGYNRFGKEISINYIFVLESYDKLSDIDGDIIFESAKINPFNKKNMSNAQYIEVNYERVLKNFKIIKLNPKKVKAEPLKDDGYFYHFAYSRIHSIS